MPTGNLLDYFKKIKLKKTSSTPGPYSILASTDKQDVTPTDENAEEAVNKILVDNPQISGPTMVNVIKSQGMKIVKESWYKKSAAKLKKKKEADTASANTASVRSLESSAQFKESNINFKSFFVESAASDDGIGVTKFKVILLQEGLGNLKDAYFYTREALESSITVFEGKKIYADHPSAIEEQTRPERSVKDVLGHFESVHIEEGESGQAMLVADVCILPDEPYRWARALMRHSVEYAKKYPDKDFVGLSINASGEAEALSMESIDSVLGKNIPSSAKVKLERAKADGVQTIKLVKAIKEAVSCDLVTEAGAGGKVLEMLEKEINMSKKNDKKTTKVKESDEKAKEGAEKDPSQMAAEANEQGEEKPADHSDVEQDKALIKKMIAEYLGQEDVDNEEMMQMCKEAYEAYMEMGMEAEEAMKCAGNAMKLAKHMASKEKPVEEAAEEKCADDKKEEAPVEEAKEEVEESKEKEVKESSSVIALKAEIAGLRESMKAIELEKHIEKTLRESGLPRAATSILRENIGTPKSVKEFDEKFKLFTESYKAAKGSVTDGLPFVVSSEKQGETKGSLSFSDCVK